MRAPSREVSNSPSQPGLLKCRNESLFEHQGIRVKRQILPTGKSFAYPSAICPVSNKSKLTVPSRQTRHLKTSQRCP